MLETQGPNFPRFSILIPIVVLLFPSTEFRSYTICNAWNSTEEVYNIFEKYFPSMVFFLIRQQKQTNPTIFPLLLIQ